MPSRYSCFAKFAKRLRKGTIVPRQGHLRARVRALLCPPKRKGRTSQTPPVNPKPRFLSIRDTRRKQVIWTLQTSDIDFFESKSKEHPYTPFTSLEDDPHFLQQRNPLRNFISPINTQNKGKKVISYYKMDTSQIKDL